MTHERNHIASLLDNGNLEIRCIDKTGEQAKIWSGVFNDLTSVVKVIRFAERKGFDTYHTVNPTSLPVTNDIKPYRKSTKDSDITEISTIFFDFDPVRPSGESSTDYQVFQSVEKAMKLKEYLSSEGWGEPTIGESGNGAHLRYNTRMAVGDLSGLYQGLARRFSCDDIDFDVTVRNPSRIARLLGTTNRKSGRRSNCVHCDDLTDASVIIALSKKIAPPKPKKTWAKPINDSREVFSKGWDVLEAFQRAGMYVSQAHEVGKHWVVCPNASNHSETGKKDSVIWEGEWPTFHCSHNHCTHLNIGVVRGMLK